MIHFVIYLHTAGYVIMVNMAGLTKLVAMLAKYIPDSDELPSETLPLRSFVQ
jgi:hypothetical protein